MRPLNVVWSVSVGEDLAVESDADNLHGSDASRVIIKHPFRPRIECNACDVACVARRLYNGDVRKSDICSVGDVRGHDCRVVSCVGVEGDKRRGRQQWRLWR